MVLGRGIVAELNGLLKAADWYAETGRKIS